MFSLSCLLLFRVQPNSSRSARLEWYLFSPVRCGFARHGSRQQGHLHTVKYSHVSNFSGALSALVRADLQAAKRVERYFRRVLVP